MRERGFPRRAFATHLKAEQRGLRVLSPGRPELSLPQEGKQARDRAKVVARAERATVGGRLINSLLVCSGYAELNGVESSFVLCGGDVRIKSCINSVVICGGDCSVTGAHDSYVVSRGSVKGLYTTGRTVFRAGGDIALTERSMVVKSELHAAGKISNAAGIASRKDYKLAEHSPQATDFVRFFETRRVGIETEQDKDGLRVSALDPEKPFALAGVKKGDLIDECDGKEVKTPEDLRRLLRKRAALQGAAELAVRRDGKKLTLRVPLD
jgi:hypothetical protein